MSVKISALPTDAAPDGADLIPFVDVSPTPTTEAVTITNLAGSAAFTSAFATSAQGTLADGAVAKSLVDAKGDLIVGTADNTVARLAVGVTNGHVLTVDAAEATGLKFAAAAGGGGGGGINHNATKMGVGYGFPNTINVSSGGSTERDSHTAGRPIGIGIVIQKAITVTAIQIVFGGAAPSDTQSVDMGIYSVAGSNDADLTLLHSHTYVSDGTTGIKTITGLSWAIPAGKHVAAYLNRNGNVMFQGRWPQLPMSMAVGQSGGSYHYELGVSLSALPTPITNAATTTATSLFWPWGFNQWTEDA